MGKTKYVYSFGNRTAEGNSTMKNLLGGKGANLAEMCHLGLPVPAGITITANKPDINTVFLKINNVCKTNKKYSKRE